MSAATTMGPVVLAHQGGWDEILLVLLPIAIFAWLLSIANKRATRQLEASPGPDDEPDRAAEGPDGPPAPPAR